MSFLQILEQAGVIRPSLQYFIILSHPKKLRTLLDFHFKNLLTIKSDPAIVGSEPSVHKFRLEKLLLFYNSML